MNTTSASAIRAKSALASHEVRLLDSNKTVKVLDWLERFDMNELKKYYAEMLTEYSNRHDNNILVAIDVNTQKGLLVHIKEIEGYAVNLQENIG